MHFEFILFDRFKKLYQLRKKSGEIQKELAAEVLEVSHRGVTLRLRADFHIQDLRVDGKSDERIKGAVNRALKEVQKLAAKKMRPKLSELGLGF